MIHNLISRLLLQSKEEKYFINNHLSFRVMYHKDLETDAARIVGFEVTPNRYFLLIPVLDVTTKKNRTTMFIKLILNKMKRMFYIETLFACLN